MLHKPDCSKLGGGSWNQHMFLRSAVLLLTLLFAPLAVAEETKSPSLSALLEKAEALKPLRAS